MLLRGKLLSPHVDIAVLDGNVVIGSTGAVGTVKGCFSFTRTGTGAYSIEIVEDARFDRLLFADASFIAASGSGIASVEITNDANAALKAGTAVTIQCYDFAGSAADPAAASVMSVMAMVRRSAVQTKSE